MAKRSKTSIDSNSEMNCLSDSDDDTLEDPDFSPDEADFDDDIESSEDLPALLHEMAINEINELEAETSESSGDPVWLVCNGRQQNFPYTGNGGLLKNYNQNTTPKEIFSYTYIKCYICS